MVGNPHSVRLTVGDPMPRIVLRDQDGETFDSWDQANAGRIRIYWLDAASVLLAGALADLLPSGEAEVRVVAPRPPESRSSAVSWLLDPGGELVRAVGAAVPAAVVVDACGRLAAVLGPPTVEAVATVVGRLHATTAPSVVCAQAPVLLVERAVDAALCRALIEHWQHGEKLADGVASRAGANRADADVKRRHDVPVNDARLFTALRDCLARRVLPAVLQAFQARIVQVELPRVGCYDAECGGWFRRHRDNTTPYTAHRQFALSLNLNPTDDYEGGEVRFPEYSRQLYRPEAGGALVFSCSLLHEVAPLRRGRRFGLFTFLHDESRDGQYRRMMAEQKARGLGGFRMHCAALWLSLADSLEGWEHVAQVV
jgi:predicted 2-oxoglutarate/Fe(II)-dependent dioxygenase YbiX